jgi:hypothetical protein
MLRWPLPWPVKLFLILAITSAVLLASYHLLVRRSFLGVFLNGRRHARMARGDVASSGAAGPVAAPR